MAYRYGVTIADDKYSIHVDEWYSLPALSSVMANLSSLGVAFFAPFDATRYQMPWQPLMDVPIAWSVLQGRLWYAQLVECQFFGLLFAAWFVVRRLAGVPRARRPARLSTPMPPVAMVRQQDT
jgi:hypothetical protein